MNQGHGILGVNAEPERLLFFFYFGKLDTPLKISKPQQYGPALHCEPLVLLKCSASLGEAP